MASYTQSKTLDPNFFARADEHIKLNNRQLDEHKNAEDVNASFLYAAARFNAWISAAGLSSSAEMKLKRDDLVEYFVGEYRSMLEENIDEYINNYDEYLGLK